MHTLTISCQHFTHYWQQVWFNLTVEMRETTDRFKNCTDGTETSHCSQCTGIISFIITVVSVDTLPECIGLEVINKNRVISAKSKIILKMRTQQNIILPSSGTNPKHKEKSPLQTYTR